MLYKKGEGWWTWYHEDQNDGFANVFFRSAYEGCQRDSAMKFAPLP